MVQRVVGVWLKEEENQAHNDVADVEDGLPVSPEDIEANVAIHVDVGVVDGRVAVDRGRLVRVLRRDAHGEVVLATAPNGVLLPRQVHVQLKLHDVGLVHNHLHEGGRVEILHVLGQTDLARGATGPSLSCTTGNLALFLHNPVMAHYIGLLLSEHFYKSQIYKL